MGKFINSAALFAALLTPIAAEAAVLLDPKAAFAERRNQPRAVPDAVSSNNEAPPSAAVINGASFAPISVTRSFEGTSDYDTRALGVGLIPPDTMGAVGLTQYVQLLNGSFSVYDKATGALAAPRITDSAFWTSIGGGTTGGDPRLLFDRQTNRWLAVGFDATGANIRIGVSETEDALGVWRSAVMPGVSGPVFPTGSIADYPTLALSGNAVVIGTNDFARTPTGTFSYQGTTLNLLNRSDIFSAAGPDVSSLVKFETRRPFNTLAEADRGFAIQGVNRDGGDGTITVVAASAFLNESMTYKIQNAGQANATQGAQTYLTDVGGLTYDAPRPARQPNTNGSERVIDSLDDRISANAWEVNGKIYFVNTVTPTGTDNVAVRITVLDAVSGNVLSQTDINDPSGNFDFYQGSLAVNSSGQLVVGYNRSGSIATGIDGRISVFARGFMTNPDGTLTQIGNDQLLKQSLVSDYHNGSAVGLPAAGRQRWGDYSAVSLDPTNNQSFWVTGQFAREFNTLANHPEGNGSGFARWGTYIAEVSLANAVPEPGTWMMMIVGFGLVGGAMRRRRTLGVVNA